MEIHVGFALMLATLAGLSTGIGSSIAYFISSLLAFVDSKSSAFSQKPNFIRFFIQNRVFLEQGFC